MVRVHKQRYARGYAHRTEVSESSGDFAGFKEDG